MIMLLFASNAGRLFKKLDMHDKGGLFFGEYLFCTVDEASCFLKMQFPLSNIAERVYCCADPPTAIWNLGTMNAKDLILYIFNLYDESKWITLIVR